MARRRYKKRYRKRYPRSVRSLKRNTFGGYKQSWSSAPANSGSPDAVFVKLNYVQTVPMTVAASEQQVFSINSVFDPDTTGSGHQPMGLPAYNNFYQNYRVYASKIYIRAVNLKLNEPVQITVHPGNLNPPFVASQSLAQTLEQPYVKWKTITPPNAGGSTSIQCYMTVKKLDAGDVSDQDFQAVTGSDPLQQKFWIIRAYSDNTASFLAIRLHVKITYYVKFYRRRNLALA